MSHDWLEAIINNSNNYCLFSSIHPTGGGKRQKFACFPNLFGERKKGKYLPQNEFFACKHVSPTQRVVTFVTVYYTWRKKKLSSGFCCGEAPYKYLVIETYKHLEWEKKAKQRVIRCFPKWRRLWRQISNNLWPQFK